MFSFCEGLKYIMTKRISVHFLTARTNVVLVLALFVFIKKTDYVTVTY